MRKRSFLLGDSIYKLNLWRPSLEIRKRSLILSDTIFKLNLNVKAVKAAFLDEKEKFTSWWFNFQVEYWFSSWLSFARLWRPSFQMRKRSFILGDLISKLKLNLKAVKEFTSWISIWRLWRPSFQMRKRSFLLGDSISKWNIEFQVDSHSEGSEGRVWRLWDEKEKFS